MLFRLLVLMSFLAFGMAPALAAKRVALVIGNNSYANLSPERQLKKAVNDARAMRDTLAADLGFTVLYREDADCGAMNGLIKQVETVVGSSGSVDRKCLKPGDEFTDCDGCPAMVVVPSGSFTMGSPRSENERSDDEGPQHEVIIARPFAVGKFEVTFEEWDACVKDGGCGGYRPEDAGWGRGRRPVVNVSWDDAQAFVKWLSGESGVAYRLLSEAEWEYAARAGTTTAYATGASISTAEANFNNTLGGTAVVGSYDGNDFGLHDMHGNVWEWVQDCYEDSYKGAPNGRTARKDTSGCTFVYRGGSWFNDPAVLRSAVRGGDTPGGRGSHLGFRLARTF